jgi:hypothetical protein
LESPKIPIQKEDMIHSQRMTQMRTGNTRHEIVVMIKYVVITLVLYFCLQAFFVGALIPFFSIFGSVRIIGGTNNGKVMVQQIYE